LFLTIISKNERRKSMATPKEIFEGKIADGIKADPAKAKTINAVYQFNVTGPAGGTWTIDLKSDPPGVKAGPAEKAGCTVTVGDADFVAITEGKLNSQQAFMAGKLKVAGDMGLAMKLGAILK
jgi:alkyl sulfatase BDS1-like metallo-beta-lactamase superfamily hydrolase